MTIEELQDKIRLAEEKVAKIETLIKKYEVQKAKKIEALNKILAENRVNKTYDDLKDKNGWYYDYQSQSFYQELYWTACDVRDKDSSISDNQVKLKDATAAVEKWKQKLRQEQARQQFIQDSVPAIIKQFLEDWKQAVIKYYTNKSLTFDADFKQYKEEKEKAYYDALCETVEQLIQDDREEFIRKYCHGNESRLYYIQEMLEEYNPKNSYEYHNLIYFSYRDSNRIEEHPKYMRVIEAFNAKYGDNFFQAWRNTNFDPDWLDKKIEEEKNAKLIDLMTKVSKITGIITDATGLHIENGDINGIIIGKDGKAKVQTIDAGGYNEHVILDSGRHGQRAHFRVLIHEVK